MISTAKRIANVEEYYFSRKLAEVRSLDTPGHRVINLGIGSPDQPPALEVIETLAESAKNPRHHGYQSYKGIPEFRQAIAEFYKRVYNVTLNPDTMILPLMGSKEGIMHISMAFVNDGEEVLIPDPGYPTYASVARLVGAKIRTYKLREEKEWGVDIASLEKENLSNVKIMWVNYPHMPTGRTATKDELNQLVALAKKHRFLIVNDNPYSLILNDSPISILGTAGCEDVALELNSLSKSHNMAGWRLGWVAGNKEYVDAVLRVKSNMDSGMFLGLQHAAAKALSQENAWFESLNKMYAARKHKATEILKAIGCSWSEKQAGLFVWAKAPDHITDVGKWLDDILYGTKVFITPGFIFGEGGNRYVRVSLCNTEEVLAEALQRIEHFQHASSKVKQEQLGTKRNAG